MKRKVSAKAISARQQSPSGLSFNDNMTKTRTAADDKNEARFFEYSRDLLCIADLSGFFLHLNPAWTHKLGWSNKYLKSEPFIEFVHPEDRHATLSELESLHAGNETIWFENRYRRSDGAHIWLNWNAHAMADDDFIYATARDVTRQKELEHEILAIADTEKQSLGRELHDGVCQSLAGLSALTLTLAKQLSSGSCAKYAPSAAEISALLVEAIEQTRNVARDLYSPGLSQEKFLDAVTTIASHTNKLFNVNCKVVATNAIPTISNQLKHHLLRIVQESINNAVTHGKARNITIDLSTPDNLVRLQIIDDGIGIDSAKSDSSGIGLHIMNYRARLIRATLDVGPGVSGGTSVVCCFQLTSTNDLTEKGLK